MSDRRKRSTFATISAADYLAGNLKKPRAKPVPREEILQIKVVDWLIYVLPDDVLWWHVPNGGKRGKWEAERLRRMGVKPGIHDLHLYWLSQLYIIELKDEAGALTEAQTEMAARFQANGARFGVARSIDEIEAHLIVFGILAAGREITPAERLLRA